MLAVFYTEDGSLESTDFEANADDMLELIRARNWDRLDDMPVGIDADGSVTCRWKDNKWTNPLWVKGSESGMNGFQTDATRHLSSEIINEIKSLIYILIYITPIAYTISTVGAYAIAYKKAARYLYTRNINSFAGLTDQIWVDYQQDVNQTKLDNPALNSIRGNHNDLPFPVRLDAPEIVNHIHKQHPVIPERLYMKWSQDAEEVVKKWSKKQVRLSQFITEQIELYEATEQKAIGQIRTGDTSVTTIYNDAGADNRIASFLSELEAQGIPLVDNNENSQWMPLFKKHDLWISASKVSHLLDFKSYNTNNSNPDRTLKFDDKEFASFEELRLLLAEIESRCIYLIFTLSGMRANEYVKLNPEYGAQTVPINGHNVHVFHTGQQKITVGYQAKKDVFVTSELGHQAYNLLNAIYEPYRNKMMGDKAGKRPFMVSLNMRNPEATIDTKGKFESFSDELTKTDFENLRVSEYGSKKFGYKEGDKFQFTSHMGRRSLAYYLVALELCGFPQIKQQFSHLSMAMSIYYAKNASRKNNMVMYAEVKDERDSQLALVLLRLREKAAQKKLSGGKGASWNAKAESVMSFEQYKKLVSDGKEFVTAVAPGLYCTNRNCCKTAQLSLVHDVGCDTSIVEHTAWVEGRRATSISKLESLHAIGELTAHDVSKEIMNIRAAESIINKHLGEGHIAEYQPPEIANEMLFHEAN